jgi:biotin transporter BioY
VGARVGWRRAKSANQTKHRRGLAERHRQEARALAATHALRTAGTMVHGNLVVYAFGVPWLMAAIGMDLRAALAAGVVPFLLGDALKITLAAGLLPGTWALAGRFQQS